MPDAFASYIRPGFPRRSNSSTGDLTEIQYVGPASALKATTADEVSTGVYGLRPIAGQAWSPYTGRVSVSEYEPLPGTSPEYGVVTIVCEIAYGTGSSAGTEQETTYEIDWANISRSLYEHPKFRPGGGGTYELSDSDLVDLQLWQNEPDSDARKAYQFYKRDKNGAPVGILETLDTNPAVLAEYLLKGVEFYDDYAPIARKSTTYAGGPPGTSDAGAKDTPLGFSNLPAGWEWLKTADRALRSGRQTKWVRTEEWTGAKKVLVDKDNIY